MSCVNLKEGTRRLALLLGVAGAISGGIVSSVETGSILKIRADFKEFERLANSGVVQEQRKVLLAQTQSSGEVPNWAFDGTPVNRDGIKTIYWRERWSVGLIDTMAGKSLSRGMKLPSAWLYVLFLLYPFLGFLVPWSAVRAIGWVLAGFVQPTN